MSIVEGWTQLDSFSYHFCRLDSISGCGKYQAACGVKGWINELVPISRALPWCNNCVRILDQKQYALTDTCPLEPSSELPPGQLAAKRWPVLHLGAIPDDSGALTTDGLVVRSTIFTFDYLSALSQISLTADMHCIMRWTVEGIKWRGVAMKAIFDQVKPRSKFVLAHGANDYFTNLTIEDAAKGLIAMKANGKPLEPEHGGPLRLVIPHLYAWKSVKWLQRLEFVNVDQPGTWEQRGLHNRGDVWAEERFAKTSV